MNKFTKSVIILISCCIGKLAAMENGIYIQKLEAVESELLSDLSKSEKSLAELSKKRKEMTKEAEYFLDLLTAHLGIMRSNYKESEQLIGDLDDDYATPGRVAMKFVLLAGIHHFRGESIEAFIATDKSLELLPRIRRDFYKSRVLTNAVSLYKDADLLEFALEYGRRSMALANKSKNLSSICSAAYELGAIELLAENFKMAQNRLLFAKSYCSKANYKLMEYAVDYSLLDLKLELGELVEAREIAEELEEKVRGYGWKVLISAFDQKYGKLYFLEGNLKVAKKYAKDSYKLAKKIKDKIRQEKAARLLAEIYTEMKDNDKAVKYFQEYMNINTENKTKIRQRKLAFDIARRGKI